MGDHLGRPGAVGVKKKISKEPCELRELRKRNNPKLRKWIELLYEGKSWGVKENRENIKYKKSKK